MKAMKKIEVNISWSGKNYVATTQMNGVVIVTHKNPDMLKKEFEDAFRFHIESSIEDGDFLPDYILNGTFEFQYEMQISAILKELDGMVTRAALSKATGMNQKQLGHYIQGKKTPREVTRQRILSGIRKLGEEILAVV